MKHLRYLYLPMLSIASMADSLIDSFLNWLSWPHFFVIVIAAVIAWLVIKRSRETN